jgi:hypothetical protein
MSRTVPELAGERDLLSVLREEFNELHAPISFDGANLASLYRAIHELETPRAALCLSGGGIRSASFALGVLQSLARHQLLEHFDYLSTVSGGGYIGAWLSAWRRHAALDTGRGGVFKTLVDRPCGSPDEPPELRKLRANSNFLTPKTGVMSADTWAGVAIVSRLRLDRLSGNGDPFPQRATGAGTHAEFFCFTSNLATTEERSRRTSNCRARGGVVECGRCIDSGADGHKKSHNFLASPWRLW